MMNGAAVSWRSTKQKTVTMSSCEAEYYALAEAAKEATWLDSLMKNVQNEKMEKPLIIFEVVGEHDREMVQAVLEEDGGEAQVGEPEFVQGLHRRDDEGVDLLLVL